MQIAVIARLQFAEHRVRQTLNAGENFVAGAEHRSSARLHRVGQFCEPLLKQRKRHVRFARERLRPSLRISRRERLRSECFVQCVGREHSMQFADATTQRAHLSDE